MMASTILTESDEMQLIGLEALTEAVLASQFNTTSISRHMK